VSKLKATASKEGAEKDPRMQNVRRVCVCVCVCMIFVCVCVCVYVHTCIRLRE
jgi:hypothetical protein